MLLEHGCGRDQEGVSLLCLASGTHFASRLPHGLGRAVWKVTGWGGDWLHLEASGYPGNADPCKQRLKSRRLSEALYGLHTGSGHVLLDVS